jgi:hypothetical protein
MADRLNLPELQRLAKELEQARAALTKAEQLETALQLCAEKTGVTLQFITHNERGGDNVAHSFRLVDCDQFRTVRPAPAAGREVLLAQMQRFAREYLIACRSKVEGIEFQIRRLAR